VARIEDQTPQLSPDGDDVLPPEFLARSSVEVAPDLLGRVLVHHSAQGTVAVRLTEVEAYCGPGDPGSHARNGRTPRTAVMFGPPAHLYVYFSYGMHWCVNVVCERDGTAAAVLLRGGEVVAGRTLAQARRPAARKDRDLARGPARLASALGLDREADGLALGTTVRLLRGTPAPSAQVRQGPRVGVSGPGGDGERYPWRFWVDGDPTVSTYRPGVSRRRPPRAAAS
jgi:DNA-3-methyladenine glycosylase